MPLKSEPSIVRHFGRFLKVISAVVNDEPKAIAASFEVDSYAGTVNTKADVFAAYNLISATIRREAATLLW